MQEPVKVDELFRCLKPVRRPDNQPTRKPEPTTNDDRASGMELSNDQHRTNTAMKKQAERTPIFKFTTFVCR